MQRRVWNVDEIDHLPPTLDPHKKWKGLDYLNFLLYELPLLASDDTIISNGDFYEMLVYFANSVYLLHHDFVLDRMEELEENVRAFARKYIEVLGASNCTWKFHVFQHFPLLVRIHGPAFLFDTFNGERILGMLKNDVKSTRKQIIQATEAFLLRHQCSLLQKRPETFSPEVAEELRKYGVFKEDAYLANLVNEPMESRDVRVTDLPDAERERVTRCLMEELGISVNRAQRLPVERVTKFRRRHMAITSIHYGRNAGSKTENSFISLDEERFGRVNDILSFRDRTVTVFDVQLYERDEVLRDSGERILYPLNQFPVRPTDRYETFVLSDDMVLRKIVYSQLTYREWPAGLYVDMFSIRPNEWFHW